MFKKKKRLGANSPNLIYKPSIDSTMRGDRFKLTPVTELLSAAATCCGKKDRRVPENKMR